jgi:hypothetical protein
MTRGWFTVLAMLCVAASGCAAVPPPKSPLPDATAALDRLRATRSCAVALGAAAKVDHFGDEGRFRGDLSLFAARPASLRMDVTSPFGAVLATLTSNGQSFALYDLRAKRFLTGPAKTCNIARLTQVPLPGHVLVDILRGGAPVLRHGPGTTKVAWDPKGFYRLEVRGDRGHTEEIRFVPRPDDLGRPWAEQRMRVLGVTVRDDIAPIYSAEFEGHGSIPTAGPRIDPDGLEPPLPPSGPACDAELPKRVRLNVPYLGKDLTFRFDQANWNPPLPEGTFVQEAPRAIPSEEATCD